MKTTPNQLNHDMLNLTPSQLDKFIVTTEKEVADLMVNVQEKEAPFKVAGEMYHEAKDQYEKANTQLAETKLLLGELVRYRDSSTGGKQTMRLVRSTSHTDKPRAAKLKDFKWQSLAEDALAALNRFVFPEELYTFILQKNADTFKDYDKRKLNKEIKPRAINALKRAAVINTKRKRGKQVLSTYKERIGLAEWLNEEMIPHAKYIKDFVFDKKTA